MTIKNSSPSVFDTSVAGSDEAAIIEIERAMSQAQEVDSITDHWAEDAVYFDFGPGVYRSREEARAEIEEQFKGVTNLRTQVLELCVRAEQSTGWAFSIQNFVADNPTGGPDLTFVFRETDLFVKEGDRWLLAHQHLSVPVDMSTGTAVLKPADPSA
ncbi:hypothetical protein GCM10009712_37830 [Pseudarthrobacter sulfonivorans]|uniref:YybH family protein n=1 Tax=Pseudarthrobacter sulfonivorans TaxID=121292 RepID=UPI00168AB0D7|nr:nuclear transport factor 2 family protein [Pseudarthrobacter sulfonivorans]